MRRYLFVPKISDNPPSIKVPAYLRENASVGHFPTLRRQHKNQA